MEISNETMVEVSRCSDDSEELRSPQGGAIFGADNTALFDRDRSLQGEHRETKGDPGRDGTRAVQDWTTNVNGMNKSDHFVDLTDHSKDDSDFSDYGEENTSCQLANQAIRAKLLTSVVNAGNGNASKLRVSVFDHRIIPKRLIVHKNSETSLSVNVNEWDTTGCVDMNRRPQTLNDIGKQVAEHGKRKTQMSYAVLKASKRQNTESGGVMKTSPTTPEDSENDVRTRFDVLLRNLIGDVDELHVGTAPTPATFSSGYESDYPPVRNVDTKAGSNGSMNQDKHIPAENVQFNVNKNKNFVNGYMSENHTLNRHSKSLHDSQEFSSLPAFPLECSEANTDSLKSSEIRDISPSAIRDKDVKSQGFSYAQRHNYKLTKVTRSMYEIIHDLQNGEKNTADGRKRFRKTRRSSQELNCQHDSGSGSNSARERGLRGRIHSDAGLLDSHPHTAGTMRRNESAPTSFSGGPGAFRSVRRPPGLEAQAPFRQLSHREAPARLATPVVQDNCNKVQNDLRNLLCDPPDMTLSSGDINGQQLGQTVLSSGNTVNTNPEFSSASGSILEQSGFSTRNEWNGLDSQRRPTLSEQFRTRTKPDDHVYETIPGDEKLYEEWKKMQQNTKIPKIRRFTTIPDLPGTFIPREPPALPERKYLNTSTNQISNKENDNYIFMGDVNSNFPSKQNLTLPHANHGLNHISSGNVLFESSFFQCYPLPDGQSPPQNAGRSDETSDGYCSIDNLSLLRESVHEAHEAGAGPLTPARDWGGFRHTYLSGGRDDYFLSPMSHEEIQELRHHQERFRHEIPRLMSRQRSRDDDQGITFKAHLTFEPVREPTKPVFQATYV